MQQPAQAGRARSPADPLEALKLYSSLGLYCFPATYLEKTPHPRVGKWGALLDSPVVLPDMWPRLTQGWGKFNVALCCHEHLVVIDLDNLDFVAWFDAQGPERLGTWIVRSPSGGLHVYAYSDDAQRTTVIKSDSGVKIGDVKARGGYVIAPPSVGPNGDYQTEYGSPDAIARQANVVTWFSDFVRVWEKTQPVRLQRPMNDAPEYADGDVHGAPPDARQEEILKGLRTAWLNNQINRKVYETLTQGPEAADGYWKNPDDRSEIDFGCVKEMIGLGWGFPAIEEAWTFLPVGERYRDTRSRNHGHGYLLRTFDAAERKWQAEQANLMQMAAQGWKFLAGAERWQEENKRCYRFTLQNTDTSETFLIECDGTAFLTPLAFRRVCYSVGIYPTLGQFDSQAGLADMARRLDALATERPQPALATREGHLREQIRMIVHQFVLHRKIKPGEERGDWDAWTDEQNVYILPQYLHRLVLRAHLNPAPAERDVWQQWKLLGGSEATWAGDPCWKAPRVSFPQLS